MNPLIVLRTEQGVLLFTPQRATLAELIGDTTCVPSEPCHQYHSAMDNHRIQLLGIISKTNVIHLVTHVRTR